MKDFNEEIFDINVKILSLTDKAIYFFQIQNYNRALTLFVELIDNVSELLNYIVLYNNSNNNSCEFYVEKINEIMKYMFEAQINKDYICISDLLKDYLRPFVINLQKEFKSNVVSYNMKKKFNKNIDIFLKKDVNLGNLLSNGSLPLQILENKYSVEYASCGLYVISLYDENNKKFYLHSKSDIFQESGNLARDWFSDDATDYIIYGLGFGYHILELMELDESISITVFESDLNIIKLMCAFTDNVDKLLSSDRIQLIYDPDFEILKSKTEQLSKESRYIIHYPSVRNIKDEIIRNKMEDYFMSYSSIKNQLHKLNNNFKKNIINFNFNVEVLRDKFEGKDLFIIAAGPSLDKNYIKLKEIKKDSLILATGTVLKKLINTGITPDYVIIIDANNDVYKQIEGMEYIGIPIIVLSTAYYKICQLYKGEKYLICQEGYSKAEKYAKKNDYHLFKTGGSVSTAALDLGIYFSCKRIICVGLDLAYTNNLYHASSIGDNVVFPSNDLRSVTGINGDIIYTSKNLDIYRRWIEKRIKKIKNIEFIDATEGGAKIKGMKIKDLSDLL